MEGNFKMNSFNASSTTKEFTFNNILYYGIIENNKKVLTKKMCRENLFNLESVDNFVKNNNKIYCFNENSNEFNNIGIVSHNKTSNNVDLDKIKRDIFVLLNWDCLKIGEISDIENIIRNLLYMESSSDILLWLNKLFLENYSNSLFVCSLLHALSHMEYDDVAPQAPTMAVAALSHNNEKVSGFALKAFENWNSKKTLVYLRSINPKVKWICKEQQRIIKYIEEYGD